MSINLIISLIFCFTVFLKKWIIYFLVGSEYETTCTETLVGWIYLQKGDQKLRGCAHGTMEGKSIKNK